MCILIQVLRQIRVSSGGHATRYFCESQADPQLGVWLKRSSWVIKITPHRELRILVHRKRYGGIFEAKKGSRFTRPPLFASPIVLLHYSEDQGLTNWPEVQVSSILSGFAQPLSTVLHQITLVSLVVANIRLPPLWTVEIP